MKCKKKYYEAISNNPRFSNAHKLNIFRFIVIDCMFLNPNMYFIDCCPAIISKIVLPPLPTPSPSLFS